MQKVTRDVLYYQHSRHSEPSLTVEPGDTFVADTELCSGVRLKSIEDADTVMIKGHPLYYYPYRELDENKALVWSADIWWSSRYQRFVASGLKLNGQRSYVVADEDYEQLVKKINEAVID